MMDPSKLVGAWELLSCVARHADGELSYPWGQAPRGAIIYTADGFMSVTAWGAGVHVSYAGRWQVGDGHVVHDIETASVPAWIGAQRRACELAGEQLTLTTPRSSV